MTQMEQDGAVPVLTRGWRMKMALAHADVSTQEMADYLEVSRDTIHRWTNDKGPVKRSTLLLWAMKTNVSLAWLQTGVAPTPDGGEGQEYTSRDSNPEPADYEGTALTWADVA